MPFRQDCPTEYIFSVSPDPLQSALDKIILLYELLWKSFSWPEIAQPVRVGSHAGMSHSQVGWVLGPVPCQTLQIPAF